MWTDEWEPVLKDVISEVLETMFFTMIDFDDTLEDAPLGYGSQIDIRDSGGRIVISLFTTLEFAAMITANLLGIDEAKVGDEEVEDALREFTNMVGGSYHARRNNPEWSLGIPMAWKVIDGEQEERGQTGVIFGCFGEPAGSVYVEYEAETGRAG